MSRLIDADALRDALQYEIDKVTPPFDDTVGAVRCGIRLARNIAEDQPTVDAIPIEYIQKRIDELAEDIRCYGGIAEYEGLTDAYCAESVALKALIERWRDHETDKR